MNKLVKVLAATALVSTALVGCKKDAGAKIVKAGLGVVTNEVAKDYNGNFQINTTFAVVGLDKDGKIVDVAVDVAQSSPDAKDPVTQSKKDLKEKYGMKGTSNQMGKIEGGAEWYEQIAKFEEYCKGKTADEVAKIETEKNAEGNLAPKAGTDLAAGCTMAVNDFQAAIAKAVENAVDVQAESVNVGYVMSLGKDFQSQKGQLNTTIAMVAKDKDGKIAAADLDVAQIAATEKADTRTKTDKKEDYGMKGASSISKEWYEQMAGFEATVKGMTADEVAKIETVKKDEHHKAMPKEGSDLATKCTMDISEFQQAIANAMK